MKKLFYLITAVFILSSITFIQAQEDCSNGLTTPFNSGGNIADGVMFEITANQNIFVTGFTGNISGSGTLEIYVKDGSYSGSETVAANWTLLGTPTVTSSGINVPTFIPFPMVLPISLGGTKSFYITGQNPGPEFLFTASGTEGSVLASDGSISINTGIGIEYPFSSTMYSPGSWNGIIHYGKSYTPSCNLFTGTYNDSIGSDGVLFDVTALNPIHVEELFLDFQSNFYGKLRMYTRPGTHVGFENDSTGWTYLGERFILNPTPNGPSFTGIPMDIYLNSGSTQAFYIALYDNSGHFNYCHGGGTVGDVFISDANIQIKTGTGKGIGLFVNDNYTPRNLNGSFGYCLSLASTEDLSNTEINVYPNPFADYIQVKTEEKEIQRIEILDISGKSLTSKYINASIGIIEFDLTSLTKGMYILKAYSNTSVLSKKIIKS